MGPSEPSGRFRFCQEMVTLPAKGSSGSPEHFGSFISIKDSDVKPAAHQCTLAWGLA